MATSIKTLIGEIFDDKFVYKNSYEADLVPEVLEAVKLARKVLKHKSSALSIFRDLGKLFKSDINEDMLWDAISSVNDIGCDVEVKFLAKSLMHSKLDINVKRPVLIFNYQLSVAEQGGNRQLFLHFIKIMHEFAHFLTPYFPRNGGDYGSMFEESVLGGRLIPNLSNDESRCHPFRNPLRLVKRKFSNFSPTKGNSFEFIISDQYIDRAIAAIQEWDPNTPFPCLRISNDDLEAVDGSYVETEELTKKRKYTQSFSPHGTQDSDSENCVSDDDDMEALVLAGIVIDENHLRFINAGYRF